MTIEDRTLDQRVADLESQSGELNYNLSVNNKKMKALLQALVAFLEDKRPEADDLVDKIESYLVDVCKRPPGCLGEE
ncbi:MAG: hypothetical protein ABI967_04415 [bacterium]